MIKNQTISIKGHLRVKAVYSDGKSEVLVDKSNQITDLHLENVAELLAQKPLVDPIERSVHSMWMESSVTPLLADASRTDTGPEGFVEKRAVMDRDLDMTTNVGGTAGLIEFRAVLGPGEANGSVIRAAGLYTRGDNDDPILSTTTRLVARQVFDAIPKSGAITLNFVWRLQYAII